MKKDTLNNNGFTLIEIIAVLVIIGIIIVISGTVVTGYIANTKEKTYQSYKADLKGAAQNYLIDCMTNNEEGCEIGIPQYGIDENISYNFLLSKGYTEKLKDPEGEGYCDQSYVIATNKSSNGVDVEYKVCLYCKNYKSADTECKFESSNDKEAPECGETTGESETWSKENKVITVKCSDKGDGCKQGVYSKSIGKDEEVIEIGNITIQDKAGNKSTCPVKAYVDRKNPTCKLKVEEVKESKIAGWSYPGVKVTIEDMQDEGSGVETFGIGTSLQNRTYNEKELYEVNNGITTVFGYVKDKVGNEGYCSVEVKVDNTKPEGVLYMGYEIYPKENSTTVGSNITVTNTSKYGKIEGVIVYFEEELNESVNNKVFDENGTTIKTSGGLTAGKNYGIIKVKSGTYSQLQIQVGTDTNNLVSKVKKIEVIKKENTTSVWTNKDISVYIEGNDSVTGIEEYSYDGGETYTKEIIKKYTANTAGGVIIKDKVGNESSRYNFTIDKIDKVAPQLVVNAYKCSDTSNYEQCLQTTIDKLEGSSNTDGGKITIDWTNKGGNFEYIVNEENFEYVIWKYNATNQSEATEPTKTKDPKTEKNLELTLTGAGYRVGKIMAYDKAGNSTTINVEIKIDRDAPDAPTVALVDGNWETKKNNTWYNYNIYVSGQANSKNPNPVSTDNGGSGIARYEIKNEDGEWEEWNYNSKSSLYKITNDGTSYRYIRAVDNAGNVSDTTTKTIKIDTTKPTCELKVTSGKKGGNDWYINDVKIGFKSTNDTGSGVDIYGIGGYTTITATLKEDSAGTTYTGKVKDKVGNENTCTINVKRDTTKPSIDKTEMKYDETRISKGYSTNGFIIRVSDNLSTPQFSYYHCYDERDGGCPSTFTSNLYHGLTNGTKKSGQEFASWFGYNSVKIQYLNYWVKVCDQANNCLCTKYKISWNADPRNPEDYTYTSTTISCE